MIHLLLLMFFIISGNINSFIKNNPVETSEMQTTNPATEAKDVDAENDKEDYDINYVVLNNNKIRKQIK